MEKTGGIHWADLEAEGFVGCGEGTDGEAVGNRESRQTTAEPGLCTGECSLALDIWLIFP